MGGGDRGLARSEVNGDDNSDAPARVRRWGVVVGAAQCMAGRGRWWSLCVRPHAPSIVRRQVVRPLDRGQLVETGGRVESKREDRHVWCGVMEYLHPAVAWVCTVLPALKQGRGAGPRRLMRTSDLSLSVSTMRVLKRARTSMPLATVVLSQAVLEVTMSAQKRGGRERVVP